MKKNGYKYAFVLLNIFYTCSTFAQSPECKFELVNYDFETPVVNTNYALVYDTAVPGWSTTASSHLIEIWGLGMNVPVYSGKQFVELNATQVSSLYQDVQTIPGTTLKVGFAHRGRLGIDEMELKIGPPSGPYISQGTYSDDRTKWGYYTIDYLVPGGQTTTRFYFSSISSAGGNKAVGNFLDAINIQQVNIGIDAISLQSCTGRIDIIPDVPEGIQVEYSLDNLNFKSDSFFENLPTGNYTVYMLVGNSCSKKKSVSVNNFPTNKPDPGPDKSICADGTKVNFDTGNTFAAYQWDSGETTKSISTSTAGQHKITVTDSNGCQSSDSVNLVVHVLPAFDLGPDKSICADGTKFNFDAGNTFTYYQWNSGETTRSISTSTPGQHTITVTDSNGCQSSDSVNLVVHTLPVFDLGPDKSICAGTIVTLDAGAGFKTYLWNTGESSSSIVPSKTNRYIVEVISQEGCPGRDSIFVNINPYPQFSLGADTSICANLLPLQIGVSPIPAYQYKWNNGERASLINVSESGLYVLEVMTNHGCIKTDSIMIEVKELPKVNLGSDIKICNTKVPVILDAGTDMDSCRWNTGATSNKIDVFSSGDYTVVVSKNGCQQIDSLNVKIETSTKLELKKEYFGCEDTPVVISAKTDAAILRWSTNDTTSSIKVYQEGTYSVSASNGSSCLADASTQVIFGKYPKKVLKKNIKVCFNKTNSFDINAGSDASTYKWMDHYSTSKHTVYKEGIYYVELISAEGCTTYDTTFIEEVCPPEIYVPNAFTPNDDTDNEFFLAISSEELVSFRMVIFNKWGELLFESININQGWDGKFNGYLCQQDVYVWSIDYEYLTINGVEKGKMTGHVNLLR